MIRSRKYLVRVSCPSKKDMLLSQMDEMLDMDLALVGADPESKILKSITINTFAP